MVSRGWSWAGRAVVTTVLLLAGVGGVGGAVDGRGWVERAPMGGLSAVVAAQETTAAQDEFVPIDQLPPEDRLPAAPFLVAAYTVALLLLFGYVWLLWRRLGLVQQELRAARAAQPRDRASGG